LIRVKGCIQQKGDLSSHAKHGVPVLSVRFLRLREVVSISGFSKSEIYRRVANKRFPAPRPYRDTPNKRFWLSSEVEAWQRAQLKTVDDYEDLVS
jgi:predicted DNA-binding transcriptional regulator AlpA